MSDHKHVAKPEQAKSINAGNALKEASASSQSMSYGMGPGEMAFTSLQSAADKSTSSNGITQLQTKANQSNSIFQLQAKADARASRAAEPVQTKVSETPTTQLKGEMDSQGLEQEADGIGVTAVQLATMGPPPAVPNQTSGTVGVVQLQKEKSKPLGGIFGAFQRAVGLKPPLAKATVEEEVLDPEIVASPSEDKNPLQEIPTVKEEVLAPEKAAPPAEEDKLTPLIQEIAAFQEKISKFNKLLPDYSVRKDQFESIKENKGDWELLVQQKGTIQGLQKSFGKEQKKVPPGRKRLLLKSKKVRFLELLDKDFSTLWEKEYQRIEAITTATTAVEDSPYWKLAKVMIADLDLFDKDQRNSNEFFKQEKTSSATSLARATEDIAKFKAHLASIERIWGQLESLQMQVLSSLAELDTQAKAIQNSPPPSLEKLNEELGELETFVKDDYELWKAEKAEIDKLLKKKKAWIGPGLTKDEKARINQYLDDNSYLSAAPVQENTFVLRDVLKSLSKPAGITEELAEDGEAGAAASVNTSAVETENDSEQSESGGTENGKLHSAEEIKDAKSKRSWTDWTLGRSTEEEKHNDEILEEKKQRSDYERIGYVENKKLVKAKVFIEKAPDIIAKLNWGDMKDPSEFDKLVATEDKELFDKVKSQAKNLTAPIKEPLNLAKSTMQADKGVNKIKKGESEGATTSNAQENEQGGSSELTHQEILSVFSEALVGVLAAVEGILKIKDMADGKAEIDGKNVAKVSANIAQAAMAGLKITSTVDYGAATNVMGFIPILGTVIKTLKVAEAFFTRSMAAHSEATMKSFAFNFQPANFDNEEVFPNKTKAVLLTSSVYKEVSTTFLDEAAAALEAAGRRSEGRTSVDPIEELNKEYKLTEPVSFEGGKLNLKEYISELQTYNLMAKLEEINHTKKVHAGFDMAKEGLYLSGQIAMLIPGGQIAAGALTVVGASMGGGKALGLMAKKQYKGDDNGIFGTGEYGKEKHAVYVMHAKKIIEMYSANAEDLKIQQQDVEQAKEKDEKIEQNLGVLEKLVVAAGAYPPEVYKSVKDGRKGYKSVGKLVSGMKQR